MDTPKMKTGHDSCDPIPHSREIMAYLWRTCYLEPSRTGGGDFSKKAEMTGVDPMIFGGRRWQVDGLCDPRRKSIIRRIVQTGGWIMREDWIVRASRLSAAATRGAELCTGMVTA